MTANSKFKNLIPLIALLTVLGLLIVIVVLLGKNDAEPDEALSPVTETKTVTDFSSDDIISLSYSYDNVSVSAEKLDGQWMSEDVDADVELINKVISSLTALTVSRKVESGNLADFGLVSPVLTVTVNLSDGSNHVYSVGLLNKYNGFTYLSVDGVVYLYTDTLTGLFGITNSNTGEADGSDTAETDTDESVTAETEGSIS